MSQNVLDHLISNVEVEVQAIKMLLASCDLGSPGLTAFDSLALSLASKELVNVADVLLLVRSGRGQGALSLIRSVWESGVLLDYVLRCSNTPEELSYAIFLEDEVKTGKWAKRAGLWDKLPANRKAEYSQSEYDLDALSQDIKAALELNIQSRFDKVRRIEPLRWPPIIIQDVSVNQYEALFRYSSRSVHGGVAGTRQSVTDLIGSSDQSEFDEVALAGILATAAQSIHNLVDAWIEGTRMTGLSDRWNSPSD